MKKHIHTYIYLLIIILLVMQFFDSYCADLYGKLQSFLLSEFLIEQKNMTVQAAVSYMGYAALPFYVIPVLAPLARLLIDHIGLRTIFLMNIGILVTGCIVCNCSDSLVWFLIGNGLVIFASSLDIQYIYIAEVIPEKKRATIRGIAGGVAAAATMLIPLLRSRLITKNGHSWRALYAIGILIGILVLMTSLLLHKDERKSSVCNGNQKNRESEQTIRVINQASIRSLCVCLFIIGIATSGITFYNEPLIAFTDRMESQINLVLLIQPVVTLCMNIASGYLADLFGRKTVILVDVIISMFSVLWYVLGAYTGASAAGLGIAWGLMIGCYFSAANLLTLTVLEQAKTGMVGKVSALATYANGAGNTIGIILCTLCVKYTGMAAIKLIISIPVLLCVAVYLITCNPFPQKAG